MVVMAAYRELESFRAAAAVAGTTHKTIKHIIDPPGAGRASPRLVVTTTRMSPTLSRRVCSAHRRTYHRHVSCPRREPQAVRARSANFRCLVLSFSSSLNVSDLQLPAVQSRHRGLGLVTKDILRKARRRHESWPRSPRRAPNSHALAVG
jgi:hypothetical protein